VEHDDVVGQVPHKLGVVLHPEDRDRLFVADPQEKAREIFLLLAAHS